MDDHHLNNFRQMASKICKFIDEHYLYSISKEKICKHVAISKRRCERIFHDYFNATLPQFVNAIRIEKTLHRNSRMKNESLFESSLECGFSDSERFHYWWEMFMKISLEDYDRKNITHTDIAKEEYKEIIETFYKHLKLK